ncbi:MAG: serine/threonine protein kinase [Actinomycetota bacterium]|nr:serine/threonine protein kinase [Actinomycetota bacterium]
MSAKLLLDGRYLVGEMLGTGGMADVYLATDTKLGREVAVKLFRPQSDGSTMARLETEARLLAALSHPGLVRVYDVAIEEDQPYLVLQLVRGTTLRQRLDRGALDSDLVARIGLRLANTLAYVHSQEIIHRDVKPSYVLLDEEGTCFLADFGIARVLGATRVTGNGQCVGTAAYLAPEQVRGLRTGPPADIYALGLMLLECLTGTPEYDGPDVEVALARLTRSPAMPGWLPPVWADVLTAMTALDPEARPSAEDTARQMIAAAALGTIPRQTNSEPGTRFSQQATAHLALEPLRPRKKPTTIHAGLALVAAMVGGLATVIATQDPEPPPPVVAPAPPAPTTTVVIPQTAGATAVIQAPRRVVQAPVVQPPAPPPVIETPAPKPRGDQRQDNRGKDKQHDKDKDKG